MKLLKKLANYTFLAPLVVVGAIILIMSFLTLISGGALIKLAGAWWLDVNPNP